jgi:hypothetical protein
LSSHPEATEQLQLFRVWATAAYGLSADLEQVQIRNLLQHWQLLEEQLVAQVQAGDVSSREARHQLSSLLVVLRLPEPAAGVRCAEAAAGAGVIHEWRVAWRVA